MKNTGNLAVYERYNKIYFKINMPWGKIIKIHSIGDFEIIEYYNHEDNKTSFKPYVNKEDINYSCSTLDEAIIYAIAHKYDGYNTRAAEYFIKMVGNEVHPDFKERTN